MEGNSAQTQKSNLDYYSTFFNKKLMPPQINLALYEKTNLNLTNPLFLNLKYS